MVSETIETFGDGEGNTLRFKGDAIICDRCEQPLMLINRKHQKGWEYGCPDHGPLTPPNQCPACQGERRWKTIRVNGGDTITTWCDHCHEPVPSPGPGVRERAARAAFDAFYAEGTDCSAFDLAIFIQVADAVLAVLVDGRDVGT